MFGSLENERKMREKREKQTLTESCGRYLHKMKSCQKIASSVLRVTKLVGVYIGHQMCETTRKLKVLSNTKGKEVIHPNGVVWH